MCRGSKENLPKYSWKTHCCSKSVRVSGQLFSYIVYTNNPTSTMKISGTSHDRYGSRGGGYIGGGGGV